MDTIALLSEHIVKTRYEDIPQEAIYATKQDILDTIAVAIAGSAAPGVKQVFDILKDWAGKKESTIVCHGTRMPSPHAALINSIMAHALDYDDTHDGAILHCGSPVIPPALAIAERKGAVSGKTFLTAITLGIDLQCRMGLASKQPPGETGWVYTSVYGMFGAATAVGKIMELAQDEMVNAFGIAYSQAAGNMQCVYDGALSKRMQPAFAAQAATLSCIMAQKGITGAREVLEGPFGISKQYLHGEYEPKALRASLGKFYEGVNLSFKPYPCCRYTHAFIDTALKLKRGHNLKSDDIEEITILHGPCAAWLTQPIETKQKPRNIVDAQFSLFYTVARGLLKGAVTIDDFTDSAIKDPAVVGLMSRTCAQLSNELASREIEPAVVRVKMKSGAEFSERTDFPYGHPKNPMSREALAEKLKDCVTHAANPVPSKNIDQIIELVWGMEKIRDIGTLAQLLA